MIRFHQSQALKVSIKVLTCCLFSSTTAFATVATSAAQAHAAVTSIQQAPYSKVFFTGSVFAVKDRDYRPDDAKIGFFSVWSKNPKNNDLQVGVHYCVQDSSLSEPGNYLTGMTILNNNQPLLAINQIIKDKPSQTRTLHPGYYTSDYTFDDPFWVDFDSLWDFGLWDPWYTSLGDVSTYVPPLTCNAGFTRFDISNQSRTIAQLPNQTLQVRLKFSDGETQNWRLGQGTVQALKELTKEKP